jgi:hypothetical protein
MDKKPKKPLEKKILPQPREPKKRGGNISKERYNIMNAIITEALKANGEMTFQELARAAEAQLTGKFDGSILYYLTATKLDLEAKKVIERVPGTKPHKVRLAK